MPQLLIIGLLTFGAGPMASNAAEHRCPETPLYLARFFPNTGSLSFSRMRMRKKNARRASAVDMESLPLTESAEYETLLADLKHIITVSEKTHPSRVHHPAVFLCWQLGQRITAETRNTETPKKQLTLLADALANDLDGLRIKPADIILTPRNLKDMARFYQCYEIIAMVSPKLGWAHYQLLSRIKSDKKRAFYQKMALENNWSAGMLERKMAQTLYERRRSSDE